MESREQQPSSNEAETSVDLDDKEKYSAEVLKRFLDIKLDQGITLKEIKETIKNGYSIGVTATNNFDIWLSPSTHGDICERNGIDFNDVVFEDRYIFRSEPKLYYEGRRYYAHGGQFDNFINTLGRETVLEIIKDKIKGALK